MGDPLELRAIGRAYGAGTGRTTPLAFGSIKATLGHTEAAAGIASVIKAALALTHRTLPPQGWVDEELNPDLGLAELGLELQRDARAIGPEVARMAVAVNGFGYGGTNAHAVLAEHRPASPPPAAGPTAGVLPLSGRSEPAVRALAAGFAARVAAGADLEHLAAAAWTRRRHHRVRAGLPFTGREELLADLDALAGGAGRALTPVIGSGATAPVFVYTGMGPQWWGMGRGMLAGDPVFAAEADRIDTVFRSLAGWSILDELRRPEADSRVTDTAVAQPANFLIQVALTAALRARGIHPGAVVGHSVGEVSAAYVTGMLSLRDALTVAHHRARLQAGTAGTGGMLAVGLPEAEAAALIEGDPRLDIAAVNSPAAVTLSGAVERLAELAAALTERGVFARQLHVEVPYHSRLMDPILDELRAALAGLAPGAPTIPLFSTVTGEAVAGQRWDAAYWCDNVRRPVRFADAIRGLIGAGQRVFLEVGPHPVLGANIRELLLAAGEKGTTVASLHRKQTDEDSVRQLVAGLYTAGALTFDTFAATAGPAAAHLPLPRYPWQRTRLRADLPEFAQQRHGSPGTPTMLGDPDLSTDHRWSLTLTAGALPWLDDHVVDGTRILPGSAYLDAALSAARAVFGGTGAAVENLRFVAPLSIEPGDAPVMEVRVDAGARRCAIRSRTATGTTWTVHATGRLVEGAFTPAAPRVPDTATMTAIDPARLYADLTATGVAHGPAFRLVRAAWADGDTVVAHLDAAVARDSGHLLHPCVLDAAWQVVSLGDAGGPALDGAVIPVGADAVRCYAPLPEEPIVVARLTAPLRADVHILDRDHRPVAQILGARFRAVPFGGGVLRRLEGLYYEERWTLLPVVDRSVQAEVTDAITLVVPLAGADPARVELIAGSTPRARVVGPGDGHAGDADPAPGVDPALLAYLRAAHREPGVRCVHVCVVAGHGGDVVADLWRLSRLALTVERHAEEVDPEPLPLTGDGTIHVSLVTERAFVHPDDSAVPDPHHAALAGARRVLLNEQPPLRWRLIDVDPDTAAADLHAELRVPGAFAPGDTDEVFLRNGLRWCTTVVRALPDRLAALDETTPLTDPEANYRLDVPADRVLSRLGWRRTERRAPGPGEVEVRMAAVGLGFKDPLKILGVLGPDDLADTHFGTAPGMEGAGTVVRVGPGVEDLAVGDRVGLASAGMIERYHVAKAELVGAVADAVRPELCTSTVSMVTAEYCLHDLARVRPGETVLVHGAAGGVGSCAIQVAKQAGARVIGAASTDERRAYVLEQGADEVVDSRSLDFVAAVLALTGGNGADIVLNTAPGEVIHQNFAAAAEFGRIVEIGKADIYGGGLLELKNFDKNLTYHSFDLDRMLKRRRAEVIRRVQQVGEKLASGVYRPLPYRTFGADRVGAAFEDALRSTATGRVALDLGSEAPPVRPRSADIAVDPAGRYLITGGFGAFGLATARRLVGRGARHLVLVGRGGARSDAARRQVAAWRAQGIEVSAERVDITDAAAVAAVIGRAHSAVHPLRAVFHAAGVLDDQRITTMDRDSLTAVFRPKLDGARTLHAAVSAAGIALDVTVLFSSGSAIMGGIGQYSYTAANLALQAFADGLGRAGERVLCVGWGAMAGGGMVDADENVQRYLRIAGFDTIDMDDGTAYLDAALGLGVRQAAIIPVDWGKVVLAAPQLAHTARVAGLIAEASADDSAAARLRAEIGALEPGQRAGVVGYLLAEQLAEVMGVAADSLDLSVPLPELGLDSLMAVEFGALVTRTLGVEMNSMQLGRSFSLGQAGARIADLLVGAGGQA
ncbi:SDR family NAD(P)-dependent oxidoreductase [Nocardia thailandica]